MLSSLAILTLLPLVALCDVFTRDDCWCQNLTHIGWKRHVELQGVNIEDGPHSINSWCFEKTRDGHGKCLDQHTKQYEICASHQAMHNETRRNDFCYYNHGNERGYVTHFSQGDDVIRWNSQDRNIPFKNSPISTSTDESTEYCEPACRDFLGWDLPVMPPWKLKHGWVESRHQVFTDIADFLFEDGNGGEWPFKDPHYAQFPGGISIAPEGQTTYWEICDYDESQTPNEPGKKCGV